jgi:hypothetical protein
MKAIFDRRYHRASRSGQSSVARQFPEFPEPLAGEIWNRLLSNADISKPDTLLSVELSIAINELYQYSESHIYERNQG